MPRQTEREYYAKGFQDGINYITGGGKLPKGAMGHYDPRPAVLPRIKRKPSAWNNYVKANSKKPRFRYKNGKINLKKMAVAFRKTPASKKAKKRARR